MTRFAPSRRALSFACGLAALALNSGAATALTPALLDPKTIAGDWSLTPAGGQACTLTLTLTKVEGAGGMAVRLGDCAGHAALRDVTNWRASSDGVSLARADRSTVLFLAKHGDDLFSASARGAHGAWTMTPAG